MNGEAWVVRSAGRGALAVCRDHFHKPGVLTPEAGQSQMFQEESEGDETISQTVGDHSRDKTLSPECHDRQYHPYEHNRYQPDPTLVEMSLREDDQLEN